MGMTQQIVQGAVTATGMPSIPARFKGTLSELVTLLNSSGYAASIDDLSGSTNGYRRASFGMTADSSGALPELLYLVRSGKGSQGSSYLELQLAASITWTIGSTPISAGVIAPESLFEAASVAVTSTGVLESRTGTEIGVINTANIATVEIPDIGEVSAVLRICTRGTGAIAYPLTQLWN